jgi:hypothetical protein
MHDDAMDHGGRHGSMPGVWTVSMAFGRRACPVLRSVPVRTIGSRSGALIRRAPGRIVIGAMLLSRSCLVPRAPTAFRRVSPGLPVRVLEGTDDAMPGDLRRGEIDWLVCSRRDAAPVRGGGRPIRLTARAKEPPSPQAAIRACV